MLYPTSEFPGKNGKTYTLRSPMAEDAGDMIAYLQASAAETEFGLSYPEELNFTVQEEVDFINGCNGDSGSVMITAFDGAELVGNASLSCVFDKQKTRHRATFGIAILRRAWGQGLGEKIVSELIACARRMGYVQLELEVSAVNAAAIGLYRKLGFQTYGTRPRSLRLKNGAYVDELLMVLDL